MKSNREELIRQFVVAKNIKNVDLNSKSFFEEFSNWLKERKGIGEKYISIISRFGLFKDSFQYAEVGKGLQDSVTLPYNTKLLTPYIDENMISNPNRVINANLSVYKNDVFPFISTEEVKIQVVPNNKISTYMTQNPYNNHIIDGWDELHNSGYNNIIVGMYGSEYDKDKQEKKDMLLKLRRKLERNYTELEYVINDEYFCVVGTKQRKR